MLGTGSRGIGSRALLALPISRRGIPQALGTAERPAGTASDVLANRRSADACGQRCCPLPCDRARGSVRPRPPARCPARRGERHAYGEPRCVRRPPARDGATVAVCLGPRSTRGCGRSHAPSRPQGSRRWSGCRCGRAPNRRSWPIRPAQHPRGRRVDLRASGSRRPRGRVACVGSRIIVFPGYCVGP